MDNRILLTGGSGFHGNAIREALRVGSPAPLNLLMRTPNKSSKNEHVVVGELCNRTALRASLADVHTVIHSASYIGYDAGMCQSVNVDGTRLLIEEARTLGVTNILYLSTVGVYGAGPHRGIAPGEATPSSLSVLSQSRLQAEELVLGAGGRVLRPALVIGSGDRWVVPSIVRTSRALGSRVGDSSNRLSIIHVRDLGRIVASLAIMTEPGVLHTPTVMNVANPEPVILSKLLDALDSLGVPSSESTMSMKNAESIAPALGISPSQLQRIGADSWFEASDAWEAAALDAPDKIVLDHQDLTYYHAELRAR